MCSKGLSWGCPVVKTPPFEYRWYRFNPIKELRSQKTDGALKKNKYEKKKKKKTSMVNF